MPLRALLLSSKRETSGPLVQALLELDLDVEHSPEIFAAIRELTSRSFDLIVADLDDGPEAEFLLKAARELQINENAVMLAVASEANNQFPEAYNGVDLVLTTPLIPEQIKYSLLGCDRFLMAYMRGGADNSHSRAQSTAGLKRKASPPMLVPALNQRTPVHRQ